MGIADGGHDIARRDKWNGSDEATKEIQKVNGTMVAEDLTAAVAYMKKQGYVNGKVGVVGYCWGGTVSWVSAARLSGLACSVCYYGGGIPGLMNEKPKCPVMFHWGETDHAISLADAKKAAAAHPEAQSFIYQAGHGFNCDHRGSYHADSAKLARTRSLDFLRKHIG